MEHRITTGSLFNKVTPSEDNELGSLVACVNLSNAFLLNILVSSVFSLKNKDAFSVLRYGENGASYYRVCSHYGGCRKFFAGTVKEHGGVANFVRQIAVRLASAGYGPVQYWFEMPMEELQKWIEVINKEQKK